MSGRTEPERIDQLVREVTRLRRRIADVADHVSVTEEQVAGTLERVAEHRPRPDAERLRARANEARRCAAMERDLSAKYKMRGGDDDRGDAADGDRTGQG
jgi:hypothetical protein